MMAPIAINSVGVVSTLGIGFDAFTRGLRHERVRPASAACLSLFTGDHAPLRPVRRIDEFNPAEHLGNKGIATLDRSTQFSIVACKQVIESNIAHGSSSAQSGVVLGSAGGSMKSISDFVRSTYLAAMPHLVSPLQFPNTVMNCAAAQCAIWHGLRGVNSTVCSGELSGLAALGYASRMLRMQHADHLIAGSVEEFCDYSAWSHDATTAVQTAPVGEGAAVFGLSLAVEEAASQAQILCVRLRNCSSAKMPIDRVLGDEIAAALRSAGISADDLAWWSPHRSADAEQHMAQAQALRGCNVEQARLTLVADQLCEQIGTTYAASISLQLAAIIATAPEGFGLLTAISGSEQVGCAVIRIPARAGIR